MNRFFGGGRGGARLYLNADLTTAPIVASHQSDEEARRGSAY